VRSGNVLGKRGSVTPAKVELIALPALAARDEVRDLHYAD